MKTVYVVQHTAAEYLGLMEDHLEGRGIRFNYFRPFADGGTVPFDAAACDGVVLLGGGPWGIVSGPLLPSLGPELRLARDCLDRGKPLLGIGLGALLLATAAGGGAEEAPLRFVVETAERVADDALDGRMPVRWPLAVYMRDRPVLPGAARVLAASATGEPLVFATADNAIGFLGHPGCKSAMIEDLIMEFDEAPANTAQELEHLRLVQGEIAAALTPMMVGLIRLMAWMPGPEEC